MNSVRPFCVRDLIREASRTRLARLARGVIFSNHHTMTNDQKEFGTIVFLKEGVELLGAVREKKTRVAVYRDTREGVYHWYELEFLTESGWKPIFRVGDSKIGEAIDLFTRARKLAEERSKSSPDGDE
jgi:hypothetical protein